MNGPKHGQDGWELVKYEWDERTGEGQFSYRRDRDRGVDGRMAETTDVKRQQMNWWSPPTEDAPVEQA